MPEDVSNEAGPPVSSLVKILAAKRRSDVGRSGRSEVRVPPPLAVGQATTVNEELEMLEHYRKNLDNAYHSKGLTSLVAKLDEGIRRSLFGKDKIAARLTAA